MTLCPFAVYKPVVNHGGPMGADLGLVVHVQAGSGSCYGFFDNPASQVSSTWWVGADGALEQYVPCGVVAWAEMAGNGAYHSVETEGEPTSPWTPEQVATLAKLIAWGHSALGWPLALVDHGGNGVTTHAHYPSGVPDPAWGDHPCPGPIRSAQLPGVLAAAKALVTPAPLTPEDGMIYFTWLDRYYCGSVGTDNKGHGIELTQNALKALQAAGVKFVPDISAGLYNTFILGDLPKAS